VLPLYGRWSTPWTTIHTGFERRQRLDWELNHPSREIPRAWRCEDRTKAAAHAMLAWLNRVREQGIDARDAGVVVTSSLCPALTCFGDTSH